MRLKLRLNCEYKENNYNVQKLEEYISNRANICLLSHEWFNECYNFLLPMFNAIGDKKLIILNTPENKYDHATYIEPILVKKNHKVIETIKFYQNISSYEKKDNEVTLSLFVKYQKTTRLRYFKSKYCDWGIEAFLGTYDEAPRHKILKQIINKFVHKKNKFNRIDENFISSFSNITYSDWYDLFYK